MSAKDKASIKAFFETGDKPTQSQFIDLIDSYVDSAGPVGVLEAAASAGGSGVVVGTGGSLAIQSYNTVRASMGITVYDTATASAATQTVIDALVATTAQANAGTDNTTLMNPVLVKNAISALSSSEVVLLGTATAASSSTLDFTSKISSSYSSYMFVFENLLQSTTASVQMKWSIDNGANYTAALNYQKAEIQTGGATTPTLSGGASTALLMTSNASENNGGIGWFSVGSGCGSMWISHMIDGDGVYCDCRAVLGPSGNVNAIRFLPSAGTFTSGKIYMYGVKNT